MKLNWKLEVRRNSAVIAVITLLLVVAVYLNWSYGKEQEDITQLSPLSDIVTDSDKNAEDSAASAVDNETDDESTPVDSVSGVSDAERFSEKQWQITVSSQNDGDDTAVTGNADGKVVSLEEYFSQARLSRQQSKDEAMTILQTTLSDENSSSNAKSDAEDAMASLASNAISESRIESLVIAKGFSDCVAVVDGDAVSVVVQAPQDGLASEDVAKIKDIVLSETNMTAEQIRIIEAG